MFGDCDLAIDSIECRGGVAAVVRVIVIGLDASDGEGDAAITVGVTVPGRSSPT